MAQRTVALCDGKYIGIETIFTVIDGKQINIPEKLKELRSKSQNNELFCPCGCGANLVLVAGDKNLREQHYRIKNGEQSKNCTFNMEGKTSVDSMIVLKCWLDDNLHVGDLESRVPICDVTDSNRKYEFSFISRSRGIALNYCYNRANLSDEKLSVLEQNSQGIKIIHIVDNMNGDSDGQYPEGLMKVQEKQRYCMLLTVTDADYENAEMKVAFYGQDIDGLWQERIFSAGLLKEYRIDKQGTVHFRGASLESLLEEAILNFQKSNVKAKQQREEEYRRQAERRKQQEIETEKRLEERRKQQEAFAERKRLQDEEDAKRRFEQEEKRRIEAERAQEERQRREDNFKRNMASNFEQQETPVRDADGNRWIKCEFCGKIAMESEFLSYGGKGHINLGTCRECSANNPMVKQVQIEKQRDVEKKTNSMVCPNCGSKLIERNGRNGRFIGCSSFPKCRYTRSLGFYG